MGKLTTYILGMSGLMLLFYFAGLLSGSPNSTLLNLLLSPENIQSSNLYTSVLLVVAGLPALAGISIGVISSRPDLAISSGVVLYLGTLFIDFLKVFQVLFSENEVIAVLLFSPIIMLFVVTLVEFWRGTD